MQIPIIVHRTSLNTTYMSGWDLCKKVGKYHAPRLAVSSGLSHGLV